MTAHVTIDFETYSEAGYVFDPALGRFVSLQKNKPGIKCVNAAVYAAHPSTRVISIAYDIGGGVKLWVPGSPPPADLLVYVFAGGLIEAHNSGFEYYIWNYVCKRYHGWCGLSLSQLRCSQACAKAAGLPQALGKLSEVLNPVEKKDKRGAQLIRLLSVPKKPTKACADLYRSVDKYPELHTEMYKYNIQDVVSEKAISAMLQPLPDHELKVWQMDQRINVRGVAIDTEGLANCINVFYQAEKKYTDEITAITGGAVNTVGEISKKSAGDKWLISQGVDLPSLDKPTVKMALEYRDMPDHCRRLLEIRQILGGSNIKKLFAMSRTLSEDGRIRELLAYCGASRTGRWSGRGPQPQNLKNSGPDCVRCGACGMISANKGESCPKCLMMITQPYDIEWGDTTAQAALATIATRDLGAVEKQWGNALEIIASCLRSLFVAGPDKELICSDYSAIEAVVLAALAGEEWRLEVFRTHGKIYEASASTLAHVPLEEILEHKRTTGKHHPLRKKGKVNELANGYAGWLGAAKAFGADKYSTDEEIKRDILAWRKASPAIVEFWGGQWRKEPGRWKFTPELYGLEGAAVSALLNPGKCFSYRDITYGHDTDADVLYCMLPSGRKLSYHTPRLTRGADPRKLDVWQINFMGWNSDSSKGPVGWINIATWGGRLCENVCQAVARDILADAMLRLEAAGYPVVLHVHDEPVAEVPIGFGSIEEFERIMMERPAWCADWPIKAAGGWRGHRYRK